MNQMTRLSLVDRSDADLSIIALDAVLPGRAGECR